MRHIKRFIYNIKYFIQDSMSENGLDPDNIAKRIALSLTKEKNSNIEMAQFSDFLNRHDIRELIHFTHFTNLQSIIHFGLIPRYYLEQEAIRIALNPVFSDSQRLDKITDANCLSISFPNYTMFYSKRVNAKDDWVVLSLDPKLIVKHKCAFSHINAAAKKASITSGITGIEQMFCNENIRKINYLPDFLPTHPQAEILEYSVISPDSIQRIILFSDKHLGKIQTIASRYNINVVVDKEYFRPRKDYQFWKSNTTLECY